MRTENAVKNIYFTLLQKIFEVVLLFIQRTVFIKTLGIIYLGVSGLFNNIFTIFSLMELGIGTSIIFLLYKPLADDDYDEISKLMQLYKKFYNLVGFSILIIGFLLIPFLKYIVDLNCGVNNIYLIYILTLVSTASSYFFSYKRSLLEADQKLYISNFNIFIFNLFATIFRIIVLCIFKDYLAFLCVTITMNFMSNIVISRKVTKMYPYIKFNKKLKFKEYNIKPILSRMFAVSLGNIGNVVLTGTDNIIMSTFCGLIMVGKYSNYYMFTNLIYTTISWIFVSITAGIGNLYAKKENETSIKMFYRMNFINYYFYFIACIMLYIFINPLLSIWIGSEYEFNNIITFIIVINLFLTGMRHTNVTFVNASGLYCKIKYKPIIEAFINLFLSILLVKFFGVIGVFIGTMISLTTVSTWIEPFIVFKEWLKISPKHYYISFIKRFIFMIFVMLGLKYIFNFITIDNYIQLIIYAIFIFLILNIIFYILYNKSEYFNYYLKLIKDAINKIKNRIKLKEIY